MTDVGVGADKHCSGEHTKFGGGGSAHRSQYHGSGGTQTNPGGHPHVEFFYVTPYELLSLADRGGQGVRVNVVARVTVVTVGGTKDELEDVAILS